MLVYNIYLVSRMEIVESADQRKIPSLIDISYNQDRNITFQAICAIYDMYLNNSLRFVFLQQYNEYIPIQNIKTIISRGIENLASTMEIRGNNHQFNKKLKIDNTIYKAIKNNKYITDVIYTNRFDDINFKSDKKLKQLLKLINKPSFQYKPCFEHDFIEFNVQEVIKRNKIVQILSGKCENLFSQIQLFSINLELKMQPEGLTCQEIIMALILRKAMDFIDSGFDYDIIQ